MNHFGLAKSNSVTNKMQVYLDMLRLLMLHRVCRHVGGTDVVTIDNSCFSSWMIQLEKKLSELD
jgi:hypothetical protein